MGPILGLDHEKSLSQIRADFHLEPRNDKDNRQQEPPDPQKPSAVIHIQEKQIFAVVSQ